MKTTKKLVESKLIQVWQEEIIKNNPLATPQDKPIGYVLGGQPGAGKSKLIEMVGNSFNRNIIIINGDDFRKYHPLYKNFQEQYKQDSPTYTAEFSASMVEAVLQKAIDEKYNIVVEGTFRTAQVPINTLQIFKNNGYVTGVLIQTCNKNISWAACLERYNQMLEVNPKEARHTNKIHHDNVVENLAKNIKLVQNSGLADSIQVFVRLRDKTNEFKQVEIYNSNLKQKINTATINKYLGIEI